MKSALTVVVAFVAALGVTLTSSAAPRSESLQLLPPTAPAGQEVLFGHITSLVRKGGRFEMRFDPAWLLHGTAAEQAALQDTGSKDVPNDYYIVEAGHRLFTYTVTSRARVNVLDKGLSTITIPVSELAQIRGGKNPQHRALFDRGNHLGFWIRVGTKYPNPVLELDQQYQP
jgi:hypothetical protein